MPIDPSIALGFKPTIALENPLDQQAKALAIRNQTALAQQRAAESAQTLQAGAQEIEAKRIQMEQNAAINKAYQDSFQLDPKTGTSSLDTDKLSTALAQGGHGAAIPGVIEATTKAHQAIANLAETRGKVAAQQQEAAGSLGAAVRQAAYDPHLAITLFQNAVNQNAVDAQSVTPIISHLQKLLDQDPSGASVVPEVKAAVDHMIAQSPKQVELDNAKTTADARMLAAQTGQKTAEIEAPGRQATSNQQVLVNTAQKLRAAKDQQDYTRMLGELKPSIAVQFPGVFDPKQIDRAAMTPEQRTQADQAEANLAETTKRNAATAANEAETRRISAANSAIEAGRLAVEKQRFGFEAGGGISDAAKSIASGEFDPQMTRSLINKNPGLISQIKAVDPKFDEANVDNRYNTLKEFTSTSTGKAGGQALALNTLIHHADLYMDAAEALKNGTFVPGNRVYNAVASAFGAAPPQNAALVARFFAGETGKVATGGVPAEGEINGILKNLSTSASPEQIKGAGNTLLQIAAGRATPLIERAKEAKIDNIVHVIGPDARAILMKRGLDPETMKPVSGPPAGGDMITVQIPGQPEGQIHASQKEAFLKKYPNATVK